MSDLTYGLFVRGQYHAGDDMRKRFEEVKAQVRLADQLGFSDLLTGMHYAAAPLQQYQLIPLLARLGVPRLYFALGGELDFQDLPARQHDEVAMFWSSSAYYASQRAELLNARAIYAQAHALGNLGNLPLAVVSASSNPWPELQADLARLSSNHTHVVVDGASHQSLAFNQRDASQTGAAIRWVVEAARDGAPLAESSVKVETTAP